MARSETGVLREPGHGMPGGYRPSISKASPSVMPGSAGLPAALSRPWASRMISAALAAGRALRTFSRYLSAISMAIAPKMAMTSSRSAGSRALTRARTPSEGGSEALEERSSSSSASLPAGEILDRRRSIGSSPSWFVAPPSQKRPGAYATPSPDAPPRRRPTGGRSRRRSLPPRRRGRPAPPGRYSPRPGGRRRPRCVSCACVGTTSRALCNGARGRSTAEGDAGRALGGG